MEEGNKKERRTADYDFVPNTCGSHRAARLIHGGQRCFFRVDVDQLRQQVRAIQDLPFVVGKGVVEQLEVLVVAQLDTQRDQTPMENRQRDPVLI